MDEAGALFFKR